MSLRQMNSEAAAAAIEFSLKIGQPVFIHGTMGIGKSAVVAQVAKKLGRQFIDIRLSSKDSTDICGIAFYNPATNRMDYAPPVDLPMEIDSDAVVFFDEMNGADASVLKSCYQVIHGHKIGVHNLSKKISFVAAGNLSSDAGSVFRIPAPLANRFEHIEMVSDFQSWLKQYAIPARVDASIIGYLTENPHELHTYNPKFPDEKAFATGRSWSAVDNALKNSEGVSDAVMTDKICGLIGEGLGIKFIAHRSRTFNLPSPSDVLKGKVKILETKEVSAKYSLITSLCYALADSQKIEEFQEYSDNFFDFLLENMEQEFCVLGIRMCVKNFGIRFKSTASYKKFSDRFGAMLASIHNGVA
jgi:AAA domain (dynein-related subfamily)